jgi:hypothetical protein
MTLASWPLRRSVGSCRLLSALTLTAALASGCSEKLEPSSWSVQHASALVDADGMSGYQTWEFFNEDWGDDKAEDDHVCARVQAIVGVETHSLEGCVDCVATWSVRTEEVDTDCAGEEGTKLGYASVATFAVGPLPDDLAADAPYGEDTLGWYLGWDGQSVDAFGYVWNERLDQGEPLLVSGLSPGERYVFWPAYAWDL